LVSGAFIHAFTACLSATPSTARTPPHSASVTTVDAAPKRPAHLAVSVWVSSAKYNKPPRKIAMHANWAGCTAAQIPLAAYAAKMAEW